VGLSGAAAIPFAPVIGFLTDRIGPFPTILLGESFIAIAWIIAATGGSVSIAGICVAGFIIEASLQMQQVPNQKRIFALDPKARSRINSLYMLIGYAGSAAGSAFGAQTFVRWGWVGSYSLGIAAVGTAILLWLVGGDDGVGGAWRQWLQQKVRDKRSAQTAASESRTVTLGRCCVGLEWSAGFVSNPAFSALEPRDPLCAIASMSGRGGYQPILDVPPQYSEAEAQLQFQSFLQPDASLNQGTLGSQSQRMPQKQAPPPPADFSYPAGPAGISNVAGGQHINAGIWSLEYYKQFFDVDSDQVAKRITASFVPSDMFLQLVSSNLELYGPFWVPTTVILSLFVTTSVAGSIAAYLSGKTFDYDFSLISFAISICYMYTFLLPTAIWGVCKWFGGDAKLLELVS
ncbi:hypothetical protein HDU93_003118, partial [Gonapodya sp. JEL0774]